MNVCTIQTRIFFQAPKLESHDDQKIIGNFPDIFLKAPGISNLKKSRSAEFPTWMPTPGMTESSLVTIETASFPDILSASHQVSTVTKSRSHERSSNQPSPDRETKPKILTNSWGTSENYECLEEVTSVQVHHVADRLVQVRMDALPEEDDESGAVHK